MRSWLVEVLHGYYFAVAFCMGIFGGIIASLYVSPGLFSKNIYLWLAVIFAAVSLVRMRRALIVVMLISGLMLGVWRGSVERYKTLSYQEFYGHNVLLSGVIADDTSLAADGSQRYKLKDVKIDEKPMTGQVWVSSKTAVDIKRSDTVTLKGFLSEGFGSFAASLARADVTSVVKTSQKDTGLVVRDRFAEGTAGHIPEPQRSLGLGYLLGLKTALPEHLQQQIQILGLTHIVVASGYNLTILVAFSRRIFVRFSKYLSAITGAGMIFGFILITGFSPSMSRAGLVAGLSLLAWYYGRKIHPITLLLIAAAVTLFVHPSYIWGDIGWYLSFAAFFGILVVAPLIHHYFWGDEHPPSAIRELIVATISAQVMTLPIILHSFGNFSLYSLPANLLVLPVIPLCMAAMFIAGVAGLALPFLATVISLPATILITYCTKVIDLIAGVPNVQNELKISVLQAAVCYSIIAVAVVVLILKTKHNFLNDKLIVD